MGANLIKGLTVLVVTDGVLFLISVAVARSHRANSRQGLPLLWTFWIITLALPAETVSGWLSFTTSPGFTCCEVSGIPLPPAQAVSRLVARNNDTA